MDGLAILFGLILLVILALALSDGTPRVRGGYQPPPSDNPPKNPPKNTPNMTTAVKKD